MYISHEREKEWIKKREEKEEHKGGRNGKKIGRKDKFTTNHLCDA